MSADGSGSGGGPARRQAAYKFDRSKQERPANPRPVRQGVKLRRSVEELEDHWLARRWLALARAGASAAAMEEGLEYARAGQTRRLEVEPGRVTAAVQGRDTKAYTTTLSVPRLTDEQWDKVARVLAEQAVFAAKLLAGSLPEEIGAALDEAGLGPLPEAPEGGAGRASGREWGPHMGPRCSCREADRPWCKHACCLAHLVADRLIDEPLLIFTLRGLEGERFLERLREQRAIAGGGKASAGVYTPRIPHASELGSRPLESRAERFWEMDPSLEQLDLPVTEPEVSHPLLRRLGTSPFEAARFPLVGLLATCYEVVSEAVLRAERGEGGEGEEEGIGEP